MPAAHPLATFAHHTLKWRITCPPRREQDEQPARRVKRSRFAPATLDEQAPDAAEGFDAALAPPAIVRIPRQRAANPFEGTASS